MTKRLALMALSIRPRHLLKARQYTLSLKDKTLVMGVVNLTPDSFSHDGCLVKGHHPAANVRLAKHLIAQGADILDVGAESSRPGALEVSASQELDRLMPTLKRLIKEVKVPISVDTYKPTVAQAALEAGAAIINDIKGTQLDRELLKLVRDYQAAIVLIHMRGNPVSMQHRASYKDVIKEVMEELKISVEKCLESGIKRNRIIIDPGIGFAKTVEHNLEILGNLKVLHTLKCPLLIGPSRKSFIGHILHKEVGERLMGTAATVALGIVQGVHMVRVHDVEAIKDVVLMSDTILNSKSEFSN